MCRICSHGLTGEVTAGISKGFGGVLAAVHATLSILLECGKSLLDNELVTPSVVEGEAFIHGLIATGALLSFSGRVDLYTFLSEGQRQWVCQWSW